MRPTEVFRKDGYVETEGFLFRDLSTKGLLWLINRTVFHPRGLALAIHHDQGGEAVGWSLWKADEPWAFDTATDDLGFQRFNDFLASLQGPESSGDSDALPGAYQARVGMVREFIDGEYPCSCHDGFKSRGRIDPQCRGCEFREDAEALTRIAAGLDPYPANS